MQGINIASVQFNRAGKLYSFNCTDVECQVGDQVVVETERGPSLAAVAKLEFVMNPQRQLKKILRRANTKEIAGGGRLTSEEVSSFTREKAHSLNLNMRILKSEVQFGGNKVIIYFTAPGRVDFRELVKGLASGLKTRVELKQVGARDETKLLGGLGICGLEYCCSSFLREFVPVSIKMAKNQNLALNPNKVSGGCGRLLCCLTYENKVYSELRQQLPYVGAQVTVKETKETVTVKRSDLLNQTVLVSEDGVDKEYKVEELNIDRTRQQSVSEQDKAAQEWSETINLDELTEQLEQPQKRSPKPKQNRRPTGAKKAPSKPLAKEKN